MRIVGNKRILCAPLWALRELLFRVSVSSSSFPCGVAGTCRVVHERFSTNGGREPREQRLERERERGNESCEVALFIHAGNERFIGPD